MPSPAHRSIVADIGGTNTRVALAEHGQLIPHSTRHYRNAEYAGLVRVLGRYIEETGCGTPAAAALAMAGPVRDGRGTLTNLDWTLDTGVLAEATGAQTVALLNDLQAQGHALGHLPQSALNVVLPGPPPNLSATQLVVGIGTGFNAAPVFSTPTGRFVPPSEAGHAALPVRSAMDLDIALFLEEQHGFASIEDALSGRGLGWIHDFLCARDGVEGGLKSGDVLHRLDAQDMAEAERARDAVAAFVRLMAGVCSDLALTLLPLGGIFLVGGMARAVTPLLADLGFAETFRDKGRFSDFLDQFSVTTVVDDDAALIGLSRHLEALLAAR
ncbi:MAG: glucokinase [Pseudomonadota bacterium]